MKIVVLLLCSVAFCSVVRAQVGVNVDAGPVQVQVGGEDSAQRPDTQPGQSGLQASAVRGSELIGLEVRNHQNESVGDIDDLVLQTQNGRTAYVALSVGGFLGLGAKLFAIPYDAIAIEPTATSADATDESGGQVADDLDEFVALLDVDPDAFDNASGFDDDTWPDMANEQWRSSNDSAFDNARQSRLRRPTFADRRAAYEQGREADNSQLTDRATCRLSELLEADVVSASGEELGEIEDVVLHADSGKIEYFAVELDDRLLAVPLSAIQVSRRDGELTLTSTASAQELGSMRSFDDDLWPGTLRPRRNSGVNVQVGP